MNKLPDEVLKMIHIEGYDRYNGAYLGEFRKGAFEDGATWALENEEVMAIINKQESAAFARWLDTYNHPIGERQSFETLYDIYKNKS